MQLTNLNKKTIDQISATLAPQLMNHHLMMFFCPNSAKREEFTRTYLKYYINKWQEYDILFADENYNTLITLSNPRFYSRKFSGWGAKDMKRYKNSSLVFFQRGNLAYVSRLIVPRTHGTRVMTIYTNPDNADAAMELVNEVIDHSLENNYTLIYESLSRRLVKRMEDKGFYVAYQRQFASTEFVETAMIYRNISLGSDY